jgi:hypothetical protein
MEPLDLAILLAKHGLAAANSEEHEAVQIRKDAHFTIGAAATSQIRDLVQDLAANSGSVRSGFPKKYVFDERWTELERCIELDGYARQIDPWGTKGPFVPIEPAVVGTSAPTDLLSELVRKILPHAPEELSALIEQSTAAFVRADWNASLSDARVFLQNVARHIAELRKAKHPGTYDPESWGQTVAFLRTSGLINMREEKGMTGAFTFASIGPHNIIGFTDEEYAIFGRTMAFRTAYFLLKRYEAA